MVPDSWISVVILELIHARRPDSRRIREEGLLKRPLITGGHKGREYGENVCAGCFESRPGDQKIDAVQCSCGLAC